jgi:hypothetical protein
MSIIAYNIMIHISSLIDKINKFVKLAEESLDEMNAQDSKMRYELLQEYLNSNPEELEKYKENAKRRLEKSKKKKLETDPEGYKTYQSERRKTHHEQEKKMVESKNIQGLLIKLRIQLADKTITLKKQNNPKIAEFAEDLKKINILREYINDLLGNYIDGNPVGLNKLPDIISLSDKLSMDMLMKHPAIGRTLTEITKKLNETYDNYQLK